MRKVSLPPKTPDGAVRPVNKKKHIRNTITYDDRKNKWEHQKGESSRQYIMFCHYRDYGVERSLSKVFGEKPKNENDSKVSQKLVSFKIAHTMCGQFHWVERATAYDIHIEKQLRKEKEQEIIKMRAGYAQIGKLNRNFVGALSSQILKESSADMKNNGEINFEKLAKKYGMSFSDVHRLIDNALKLERYGLGDTEQTVEVSTVAKEQAASDTLPIISDEEDDELFALKVNKKIKRG